MNKNIFLNNKSKTILMSLALSSLLIGCGSSSSDNKIDDKKQEKKQEKSQEKSQETNKNQLNSISGKIIDGYIDGAKVCIDINANNKCDNNEIQELTDDKGNYSLVTSEIKDISKYNIIAYGGIDLDTNKKFHGVLKSVITDKNNLNITPITTLLSSSLILNDDLENTKKILKEKKNTLAKILDLNVDDLDKDPLILKDNKVYKKALAIQKAVEILASIDGDYLKVYSTLANSMNTQNGLKELISNSFNSSNKTFAAAIQLVDDISKLSDNASLEDRINVAKISNAKSINARKHFQNSDEELLADPINFENLKYDLAKIKLQEIGLADGLLNDISKILVDNNIKDSDFSNNEKLKDIVGLEVLIKLNMKKENATSKLKVLKVVQNKDSLEIYFSHKVSQESIDFLSDINNIKYVYNIKGLSYKLSESTYNAEKKLNVITFEQDSLKSNNIKKDLFLVPMSMEDEDKKYNLNKIVKISIEKSRLVPKTGQKLVWEKYDDASLSDIGTDLEYKKENNSLISNIANLQWQDQKFSKGENSNINISQAKNYCENLNFDTKQDWRLPNIKEFITTTSIAHDAKSLFTNNSFNDIYFTNVKGTVTSEMLVTARNNGEVLVLVKKDENHSVRCVRDINDGSIYPNIASDNIILLKDKSLSFDPTLKLMYDERPYTLAEQKAKDKYQDMSNKEKVQSEGRFGNFKHAVNYCQDLVHEGFNDWRLTNVNELFYSYNSTGYQTFQNRDKSMTEYNLTSSNLLIDDTNHHWIVGNYFNRKTVNDREMTNFRCVRSMDNNQVVQAKEKSNIELKDHKRKFIPVDNKVDITMPVNFFSKYVGINLMEKIDNSSTYDKKYQIQMLKDGEIMANNTLVSVKKVGDDQELKDIDGYFSAVMIWGLVQKNNGRAQFKAGEKYTIIINNRIEDITINLTLSGSNQEFVDEEANNQEENNNNHDNNDGLFDQPLKDDKTTVYVGSQENFYQLGDLIDGFNDIHPSSYEIVSGNENNYFSIEKTLHAGVFNLSLNNKLMLPGEYKLTIIAKNGDKKSKPAVLTVDLKNYAEIEIENKDFSLTDKSKANWIGTRLIELKKEDSYYEKSELSLIKNLNNFEYLNISYELENSENYKISEYLNYMRKLSYGVFTKKGKKEVAEKLTVKIIGKIQDKIIFTKTAILNITE
ncbi:MAG: DUF1566 domain-containing protein [Campylobacterales bacterium]|nr:DUF1566 domain-containing protein [Campylobacterales bacterium]